VAILGPANLPSELAPACTSLYARNLYNFVQLLIDKDTKALVIDPDDELIQGTMITKDGKVVHPRLADAGAA
jgi:NAD(P) transhydrogenase subunit alpha